MFRREQPSERAFPEDVIDREVTARAARQEDTSASDRRKDGAPPTVGEAAEVSQARHVEIQVMPTDREQHAGMAGELRVVKRKEGKTVGYSEGQLTSRLISDPQEVQILEMRYGMIRAQALTPRESPAFIEEVLGETPQADLRTRSGSGVHQEQLQQHRRPAARLRHRHMATASYRTPPSTDAQLPAEGPVHEKALVET